ncbi:DUF3906 family protein [Brevibacillus dissolubilis]|uniref:DUF3906 family protein n=1 Tax=Brevibacillus dissolubilis TaxID=1844116 RepID=UPI0011173CA6|nr:DUF3906 family protein [Brevibacillus dissolubilis]
MKQSELFMYHVQVDTKDKGRLSVIVLSPDDEQAFDYAERELEKHYLSAPELTEAALFEKRRVQAGSGYVVDNPEMVAASPKPAYTTENYKDWGAFI